MEPLPLAVKALRAAAETRFKPVRCVTDLPSPLTGKVIQFERIGGPDSTRLDRPVIDVDAYAPTRGEAEQLAHDVRAWIRYELPGQTVGGMTVSDVSTISGPSRAPYSNTGVWRFTASYSLAVH